MNENEMCKALREQNIKFLDNQEADHFCPRCGKKKLNDHIAANRTSKQVKDVLVCANCSLNERYRKELDIDKLDISDWYFFKKEVKA